MANQNLQEYGNSVRNFIWGLVKQLDIATGEGEYFEDATLIDIIRKCPILYNKKLAGYRNEVKKDYHWDTIAEVFGTDRETVKGRWRGLRAYYSRHRNNLDKLHISELSFLYTFVKPRIRIPTFPKGQPQPQVDFIESVRKRPELYSKKSLIGETLKPGEHLATKIKNSWIEVAKETGSSVEYCQRQWQSLRNLYVRIRKGRHRGLNKSSELYEKLQFLNQHVTPRRRFIAGRTLKINDEIPEDPYPIAQLPKAEFVESIPYPTAQLPKAECVDSNQIKSETVDMPESMILTDSNSDSDSSSNCGSFNETTGQDTNSITSNTNSGTFISGVSPLDDEDGNFGKAIAADLRNIPCGKKKLLLKASIYKLLYEAMDDDISPNGGECFEDTDLIAVIRNCPILYDKRLPEYKSETKKDYFWDAIADAFGVEREILTNRWLNLRAYYSKYRNNPEKPHVLELKFLEPFVISRNRTPFVEKQPSIDALIESVESRPELYVKKNHIVLQAGEDIESKIQNSWIEVSNETGASVQFCQKKWLYLREMYSKTRKQLQKGEAKPQFFYYDRLHFLNEHIATRRIPKGSRSQSIKSKVPDLLYFNSIKPVFVDSNQFKTEQQQNQSFTAAKAVLISNNEYKIEQQEEVNESFTLSDNESLSSGRNSNNDMDINGQCSSSITSNTNSAKAASTVRQRPEEEDEDDKFGKAIAADLKNLPFSKKKLKLKANIYQLLCEAIDDES